MTPKQLSANIRRLRPNLPLTRDFEDKLTKQGYWNQATVWYSSQKEHWLGWLSEYDGPGHYDRKNWQRSAEFIYNHIVCPPMILWLAEASGVPKQMVSAAAKAALISGQRLPAKSAAIRKCIPWQIIEAKLGGHPDPKKTTNEN